MDFVQEVTALVTSVEIRRQYSSHQSMTVTFAQPWAIYEPGKLINVDGKLRTQLEVRQILYENIIEETLFIARASEGAVSAEWIMEQPIFIRNKYVKSFQAELDERRASLNNNKRKKR